jgi:hypothetical protein
MPQLEKRLAEFTGFERALLFSTGYLANLGTVPALVGRGDAIFSDRLNHASLIDAARLSRAELNVYPHCDLSALAAALAASRAKRKLIVTDAVFSMDGDLAPLAGTPGAGRTPQGLAAGGRRPRLRPARPAGARQCGAFRPRLAAAAHHGHAGQGGRRRRRLRRRYRTKPSNGFCRRRAPTSSAPPSRRSSPMRC